MVARLREDWMDELLKNMENIPTDPKTKSLHL